MRRIPLSKLSGKLLWLVLLVGLACVSRTERIAYLKSQFVGQPASLVRSCLGDPNSISLPAQGVEEIGFRWNLPPQRETDGDLEARGSWNRGRGPWLPPVTNPNALEDGFCEVFFTLEDRAIREVRAVGKTAEGLNAEHRCLEVAQRCLEP